MASPDSGAPLPQPTPVDTDPSSSFICDYVAGVNRVLSLPPYLLVDNIARNVEMWRFEPDAGEPAARARYDLTSYPNDPDASLLDVDIHAAFLRHGDRELLTINHFGRLRRFDLATQAAHLQPTGELQLLGDTERVVLAGNCFIGSSPRGEHTDDPARPGLFIFEPLPPPFETTPPFEPTLSFEATSGPTPRLAWEQVLADWGVVSALTVSATGTRLAVAAGSRLGVFDLTNSRAGLGLGECHWERALPYHCQWMHLDEAGRLWAAGHRPSAAADSGDWDECRGGELHSWAADTGAPTCAVELPDATAWGYGADPVVPAPGWRHIYVLGRDASLHAIDVHARVARQIYRPLDADVAAPSLGIGHAAMRGNWIYAGFSRGGFRLRRYHVNGAA